MGLGFGKGAKIEIHASRDEARRSALKEKGPPSIASLDALGVTGVAAFFDSLGLGAYTSRIRGRKQSPTACDGDGSGGRSGGGGESPGSNMVVGIDGAELARIASASDPDTELLDIGVSARLHRVKLLTALGVRPAGGTAREKTVAPGRDAGPAVLDIGNSVSCAPPVTPVAGKTALFMVQSIRREQEAMEAALRKVTQGVNTVVDPPATKRWSRHVGKEEEEEEEQEEEGGSHGQGDVTALVAGSGDNGSQKNIESSFGSSKHSTFPAACRAQQTGTPPAASGLVTTGGDLRPRIDGERVLLDGLQTAAAAVVTERKRTTGVSAGGIVSVPLRLLPELEEAFSAQARLSSQVKNNPRYPPLCCRFFCLGWIHP